MIKHTIHIRYIGYIPLAEISIEMVRVQEHTFHIFYIGNVPLANVSIKVAIKAEHKTHICYQRHIDKIEIAIRTFFFDGFLDELLQMIFIAGNDFSAIRSPFGKKISNIYIPF